MVSDPEPGAPPADRAVRAGVGGAPSVGVVIVGWNNESLLTECLASVFGQSVGAAALRVVYVDNGSDDGSVALVRRGFPAAEVVEIGWNSGFAHANNVGIAAAFRDDAVDAVVLLNTDARLAPDWIDTVGAFARSRARGATFQSLTLDANDHTVIDSHHIHLGHSLHAMQAGTGTRLDRSFPTERVYGVNAAACLYTRSFLEAQPFEEVFDERLFMYLEDVDLAARAVAMGWESWFVEGTRAYHIGSASAKTRASGFALRQTWRNQPVVLLTNLPWRLLGRGLLGLLKHERGAVQHLRVHGTPELVGEIRRGRREGLRLIPHALRRRRQLAPLRTADPDSTWELMRTGTVIA